MEKTNNSSPRGRSSSRSRAHPAAGEGDWSPALCPSSSACRKCTQVLPPRGFNIISERRRDVKKETITFHHLTFNCRLTSRLLALIQLLSTAEHPLVLFVDDLQWADAMSLNLIQLLFEQPSAHLLIIGYVVPTPSSSSPL